MTDFLGNIFGGGNAPPPPPQGVSWRAKIYKMVVLSVPPSFEAAKAVGFVRDIGLSVPISFYVETEAFVSNRDITLSVPMSMPVVPADVTAAGLSIPPSFKLIVAETVIEAGDIKLTVQPSFSIDGEAFARGFPYTFPFKLS